MRTGAACRRSRQAQPHIDGLSSRAQADIARFELTRNHLCPGDVATAVRLWREYVHRPARQVLRDDEWGSAYDYCCGDPREARALLDRVMRGLPRRSARELRSLVGRFDAAYGRVSPSHVPGDR